jgi:hypothetical protein
LRNGHIGRHASRQYSAPTSGPVVFLLEQGEDLQIALDIFSPICRGR